MPLGWRKLPKPVTNTTVIPTTATSHPQLTMFRQMAEVQVAVSVRTPRKVYQSRRRSIARVIKKIFKKTLPCIIC